MGKAPLRTFVLPPVATGGRSIGVVDRPVARCMPGPRRALVQLRRQAEFARTEFACFRAARLYSLVVETAAGVQDQPDKGAPEQPAQIFAPPAFRIAAPDQPRSSSARPSQPSRPSGTATPQLQTNHAAAAPDRPSHPGLRIPPLRSPLSPTRGEALGRLGIHTH